MTDPLHTCWILRHCVMCYCWGGVGGWGVAGKNCVYFALGFGRRFLLQIHASKQKTAHGTCFEHSDQATSATAEQETET